jgi:hypothetical protein
MAPVGLASLRFDEVQERFRFGVWADLKTNAEFEHCVREVVDSGVHTASFGDVSPGFIAEFRMGNKLFSETDLDDADFGQVNKSPKFDFTPKMRRMEH